VSDATDRFVRANLRHNLLANTLDRVGITFGLSFVSQATILPLLVSTLTSSQLAIGLIPMLFFLGFNLPQLLASNFVERLERNQPYLLLTGIQNRLGFLEIALVVYFVAPRDPTLALALFFLVYFSYACAIGISMPAWIDLIAKVIPLDRRGRFFGVSNALGGGLAVLGALAAREILARFPYPANFALCFTVAFLAAGASYVGLALNREPALRKTKPPVPFRVYLARLPALLHRDRNFARFLVAASVVGLGRMAEGFIAVYAVQRFAVSAAEVGTYNTIVLVAQALSTAALGWLADRRGHKVVWEFIPLASAVSLALVLLAPTPVWLYGAFGCLGVVVGAYMTSNMAILVEFCAPEDRPTYAGVANTVTAPFVGGASLIGGAIASVAGYPALFVVALVFSLLGLALLHLRVREPRLADTAREARISAS